MKTKDKIILIAVILGIFCWLVYLIESVLAPFIFALVVAYFLDPFVDYLQKKYKLSRLISSSLILGSFVAAFVALCSFLLPIIYDQLTALIEALPNYSKIFANDFYPKIASFLNKFGFKLDNNISHLMADEKINSKFIELSKNIFDNAITSSIVLINIISIIFIAPILVFYLLKDWDLFLKKIDSYLPRRISAPVKEIAKEIDKTLSGYIRGQFNVCIILAIIYASLLSICGLNFGFLIGFLTGLFSFVPYIGMLLGVTAAIIASLFQWGFDISHITIISSIFIFGQAVESNFLTPKLIGSKIGLHPIWIIFGLFVFGALFGFVGVLIAVPLTGVCGVIIKYFAIEYKKKFT